jgi:hypothetical protein
MTRQAREAISLAGATALGEAALQALVITDWSSPGAHALLFAFLLGPPLFLALLAWRRREQARLSRVLFVVAVLLAVGGLGALGFNLYRFSTDPAFRKEPNMTGLVVPLAQWAVVMGVWFWLVAAEAREKHAARQSAQGGQAANTPGATKPPQSP